MMIVKGFLLECEAYRASTQGFATLIDGFAISCYALLGFAGGETLMVARC